MNIRKEYKKDGLTVIWRPDMCFHAGICFQDLPGVFKPLSRPWVDLEGADPEDIRRTVRACPSGALSLQEDIPAEPPAPVAEPTRVNVIANGPVRVTGPVAVHMPDGTVLDKPNGISFCRCGQSARLPFCDSSHKTNGFEG